MKASLPRDDAAPAARNGALAAQRAIWRFDPSQRGLPLAAKVDDEKYSLAYVAKVVEYSAMLAATRAAAKLDPRLREEHAASKVAESIPSDPPAQDGGITRASMVRMRSIDHYAALFDALPNPAFSELSEDDGFFAWQRLAGCNAAHLRQQRVADPRFPVTNAHFRAALGAGDSLDRARGEGRLFALDLSAVHGLPPGSTQGFKRHCGGSFALFARTLGGRFAPVAIQPTPNPGSPIYTPADGERWRHARLGVQVADAVWAGAVTHLGACHSLAGGVQVCTARELAPNHPLRLLLWPHFEMTTAANETMKVSVIGKGGYFDELLAPTLEASIDLAVHALRTRSLADAAPWRDVASRGCDSVTSLPEYPYRDDGLPIAYAVRRWVEAYLRLWYTADQDLVQDTELVAWQRALGATDGAAFAGVPALGTIEELVDLVTTVIFQVTAGHAVVNYSGYDYYGWAPTYPTARWSPPPGPEADPTPDDYLAALAPLGVANRMLDLTLPQRQLRLNTLGAYPRGWFTDPRVRPLEAALQADLEAIENQTLARDAARTWSSPYLLPSRIAQSIHV